MTSVEHGVAMEATQRVEKWNRGKKDGDDENAWGDFSGNECWIEGRNEDA